MKGKLTFIVVTPTVRTNIKMSLRAIVGGIGRFDVLSRCFLNLSRWSVRLPFSINFMIYFSHPKEQKLLEIDISRIFDCSNNFLLLSELDATLFLQKIFLDPSKYFTDFISVPFESLVARLSSSSILLYLTPQGLPLNKLPDFINCHDSLSVVLGSQADLSLEEEKVLHRNAALQVSLGDLNYLASHCITLLCHKLSKICYYIHNQSPMQDTMKQSRATPD